MLIQCFISSLHHLKPYLAKGIPEIDLPTVEPFRMDSIKLSLGSGPRGYRVELTDIDIYGASNFTVDQMKYATFHSRISKDARVISRKKKRF